MLKCCGICLNIISLILVSAFCFCVDPTVFIFAFSQETSVKQAVDVGQQGFPGHQGNNYKVKQNSMLIWDYNGLFEQ